MKSEKMYFMGHVIIDICLNASHLCIKPFETVFCLFETIKIMSNDLFDTMKLQ